MIAIAIIPNEGSRIVGAYFGQPFSGTLESRRPHTMSTKWIFFVAFDAPVTVYGLERRGACLELCIPVFKEERFANVSTGCWIAAEKGC